MSKEEKRWTKIIDNTINCFETLKSPFSTEELQRFEVTADECYILSQQIAGAMRLKRELYKKFPKIHDRLLIEQVIEGAM